MQKAPLPSICPTWKQRLQSTLVGIMAFTRHRHCYGLVTHARSHDARSIMELVERDGVLLRGSLQLALPQDDELEMLKLGCWTIIYLKSLFPDWTEIEGWIKEAAEWSTETGRPISENLSSYQVLCRYDRIPNVLEYQVLRVD